VIVDCAANPCGLRAGGAKRGVCETSRRSGAGVEEHVDRPAMLGARKGWTSVIDQLLPRRRRRRSISRGIETAAIKARVYGRLNEELERTGASTLRELDDARLYEISEEVAASEGMTFDELNAIMASRT
jgi:hypothetical protein